MYILHQHDNPCLCPSSLGIRICRLSTCRRNYPGLWDTSAAEPHLSPTSAKHNLPVAEGGRRKKWDRLCQKLDCNFQVTTCKRMSKDGIEEIAYLHKGAHYYAPALGQYSSLSTHLPLPLPPFSNSAIVFNISLNSAVRCGVPQNRLK